MIDASETNCLGKLLHISCWEQKTNDWGNFSSSPTWSTRPTTGCETRSTSLWAQRKLYRQLLRDGNSHVSDMSRATTASPEPSLGHLGGWATPWSAEKMLDGQHQKVDIPAHTRTAHKGLLQKRPEGELCWIVPHVFPTTQSVKEMN